jgi:putative ABC transport system ATP-binding protein
LDGRPEAAGVVVSLRSVTKRYRLGGEDIEALLNVDLEIQPGDFIAVMGPSGSGKSTMAHVVGGLDRPDSGQVLVGGRDLAKMGDRELSSYRNGQIGFIFQSFNLQPSMTAIQNVALPMVFAKTGRGERTARAREALAQVGMSDREKHRPAQLSGGQRQRVAIARALANRPSMIIADEPTGNLDSKRGQEIMALLKTLNDGGVTTLVITHDPQVAAYARRTLHLLDGKLN